MLEECRVQKKISLPLAHFDRYFEKCKAFYNPLQPISGITMPNYSEWIERHKASLLAVAPSVVLWQRPDRTWVTGSGDDLRVHIGDQDWTEDTIKPSRKVDTLRFLLYDFLMLAGKSSSGIKAFVRQYGRLGLDLDGLPPRTYGAQGAIPGDEGELVSWYQTYAQLAVAVLRVAEVIARCPKNERRPVADEDYAVILRHSQLVEERHLTQRRAQLKQRIRPHPSLTPLSVVPYEWITRREGEEIVAWIVNWWNSVSYQFPYLERAERPVRWVLPTWSGGVWGALGLSLGNAITRDARVAICAHCQRSVKKMRMPRAGTVSWCKSRKCLLAKKRLEGKRRDERKKEKASLDGDAS